jgi:CRP-like cAMP-binding protein
MSTEKLPPEVQALRDRIATDPDDFDAREALADTLYDLGDREAGIEQLFVLAERLAGQSVLERAISCLERVLELEPEHDRAKRLRALLFARVPRQPKGVPPPVPEAARVGRDEEDALRREQQLFELPEASAQLLARILPFDEEDPEPVPGPILVPVPPGPSEGSVPLLATLDKELTRHPSAVGDRDFIWPPVPAPPALPTSESVDLVRVSPASEELSIYTLPPNPIIDVLETEDLQSLLDRVDLLCFQRNDVVFDAWTRPRALYIVIRGTLKVVREAEGRGEIAVDVLHPGDFYGEFELLTVVSTGARVIAIEPVEVLEVVEGELAGIVERAPDVQLLLWDSYFNRSFHSAMAVSDLFSTLPNEVITRISSELVPLQFEAGDIVLRTGELPQGLYGVVGGSLAVVDPNRPVGEILTRLAPGNFFGVLSSASGDPVSASVVATEASTLLWLPPEALAALREQLPLFAEALAEAGRGRSWRYSLE